MSGLFSTKARLEDFFYYSPALGRLEREGIGHGQFISPPGWRSWEGVGLSAPNTEREIPAGLTTKVFQKLVRSCMLAVI